jgi:hypothetical protein
MCLHHSLTQYPLRTQDLPALLGPLPIRKEGTRLEGKAEGISGTEESLSVCRIHFVVPTFQSDTHKYKATSQ